MRSPLGALASLTNKAPVPYAPRAGGRGRFPLIHRSGREQQLAAMGSVGTLFAIVNRQAKAIGGAEWKLYRKAKSGRDEDRVEVTSHAALDLWNAPNPFFNRQVFAEAGAQHKLLTGETWWVLARNPRSPLPLEAWPVRPDRMEPVPDPDNFLAGYMYYGPGGEQIRLELEDVIFIRTPNPLDPYRGLGPVQSILIDIDATRYSAEWNRNFFLNSAEPGGIIEVPGSLSDPDFDKLRARWAEQHKGVANAHRVAILEHGKWVDRKYTQRDMQFAELRSVSREVIREAYGFPKSMLGTSEDVNRANAEQGERMFARWLIVPELDAIKAALNTQLLPLYGPGARNLEFDYVNPVPEDRELEGQLLTSRANAAKTLGDAGWDPDDVLSTVGLPPMRHTAVPAAPAQRPAALAGWAAATRHLVAADDAPGDGVEERHLTEIRHVFEAALAALLRDWEQDVLPGWYSQIEAQVQAAVNDDDAEALAGISIDPGESGDVLRRALGAMAVKAAGRVVSEAADQGVTFDAPEVDEELLARLPHLQAAFGSGLVGIAKGTVANLASALSGSAAREALRLFRPGESDGGRMASKVGQFVRGLSPRFRTDMLGGALHRAQNVARLAAIAEGQAQTTAGVEFVAAEKNDTNRCGPCTQVDGRVFGSLAEARDAYGGGGFVDCAGGVRCRGTVLARWQRD